jgi:hypothetical protein
MPNPIYITSSSTGVSTVYVDRTQSPFNLTVGVALTSSTAGTATFAVQYTLDDPNYLATIGSTRAPIWFNDAVVLGSTGVTNSYTFPIAGLRNTITAISSTNVIFTILQGGTV